MKIIKNHRFLILSLLIGFIAIFTPGISQANSYNSQAEISNIDAEIKRIEDASPSIRGVKVIGSSDAERIHELQLIKKGLETGYNFTDELDKRELANFDFMIASASSTMKIDNELASIEKEMIEAEIKNVLENIDLEDKYLKNLTFVASPYKLRGINGFTLSQKRGNDLRQTVVISHSPGFIKLGSDFHRELVRSTVLHELGHVYQNSLRMEEGLDIDESYKEYYSELNRKECSKNELENWKNSANENFAEDFRIYYSDKLKEHSFQPRPKKTNLHYNDRVAILFEDLKKN